MRRSLIIITLITIFVIFLILGLRYYSFDRPSDMGQWPAAVPFDYELIYNENNNVTWMIWDTGYCGFSEAARILRERGVHVSSNTEPLNLTISRIPASHISKKIIFLNVAKFEKYPEKEIEALLWFVKAGGKLLVIGEHDNFFETSTLQNPLLEQFGMMIENDHIDDRVKGDKTGKERKSDIGSINCAGKSSVFGLYEVGHLISATASCVKGCVTLLEGRFKEKWHPIAIGKNFGRGKILLLTDSEIWWNGDGKIGIDYKDNKDFFIHCIQWLLERTLVPVKAKTVHLPATSAQNKNTVIHIDLASKGRGIDDSLNGVKRFARMLSAAGFDIISGEKGDNCNVSIIVGPVDKIDNINNKTRLILFTETFMQLQPYTDWGRALLKFNAVNRRSIYHKIEETYGITIVPSFLTDGGTNGSYYNLEIPLFGNPIKLHTANAILPEKGSFKTISLLSKNAWSEKSHPGLASDHKQLGLPQFDESKDIRPPTWIVYNDRILVIGDSDLISNCNSEKAYFLPLVGAIINWIDGKSPGFM